MTATPYDRPFIEYAASSSAYAARKITSLLAPVLGVTSVLDVGCAAGTWLRCWGESGATALHGVDGDYVQRDLLEIDSSSFTPIDLNDRFDLGRRFDLVQSLEVAEHVNAASSETFIANMADHAERFILFSAAPPGQGGEYHINERPYDFWRGLLAGRGFVALDYLRPQILDDGAISYWYRYNMFLFARREALGDLPPEVLATLVPKGTALKDVSPTAFQFRKAVVRQLPYAVQHQIAKFKSRVLPTGKL